MRNCFKGLFWLFLVVLIPFAALFVLGIGSSVQGEIPSAPDLVSLTSGLGLAIGVGAIDMYSTRTLLSALEYMKKPTTFFLELFFTVVDPVDSDTIDIDIVRNGENMAAFVSPIIEGKVVANEGFTTHTIKAPYIKEKMLLTAEDLMVRDPGKTIYGPNDGQEKRIQKNLAKKLRIMLDRFTRREEWMAAQGLTTGRINIVGEGVPARQIDFDMRQTHLPVNLLNALWNNPLSDPIANLKSYVELILDDSGRTATKVIMGSRAARDFLAHAGVRAVLDNRRIVMGEIAPGLVNNGAQKIADWFDPNVEIWTYSGKYIDPATGNRMELMPPNAVLVGCTGTRAERHYAKIQDVETGNAVVQYFPKSWPVKDPSGIWIMLQTAPLPAVHEIDAFVCATVTV